MKVLCVLGTRPEIIRLSRIIPKLDKSCELTLVHTGQSYDANMSQIFFQELDIRKPDINLEIGNRSPSQQIGLVLEGVERVISKVKPDKCLILGDTNSAWAALAAKRLGVKVYHMEAGNRAFDDRIPEEVNRRGIDAISDVWLPYTERSRQNLLAEGKPSDRIFVTGNPIWEVIKQVGGDFEVIHTLKLEDKDFVVVTAHRQENVDSKERLRSILDACLAIADKGYKVVFSVHPRTRKNMKEWDMTANHPNVIIHEPFGFKDFLTLERNAKCIITDSGTVCEEAVLLRIPCVTIRDKIERAETIECGANILSGVEFVSILRSFELATSSKTDWIVPPEYLRENVSDTVVKIVTGV